MTRPCAPRTSWCPGEWGGEEQERKGWRGGGGEEEDRGKLGRRGGKEGMGGITEQGEEGREKDVQVEAIKEMLE